MGKLTNSLLLVFFIQFILSITLGVNMPGSTLYDFLVNPISWDLNVFLSLLTSLPALAGVTGIAYGTLFRNDLVTFAGLTVVIISFGQSLPELFNIIKAQFGYEWAVLIVSPIILIYVFAGISFWRGQKD